MNQTTTAGPVSSRTRLIRRSAGVIGAGLAALVVWLLAVPVGGIELAANPQGVVQQIGLDQVLIVALGAGLVGWGLLAALERLVPARARLIWTIVAAVVLVLSLFGPIGAGVGVASKLVLSVLHLVVGALLIITFTRDAPAR
jgi:hypothetical protein